MNLSFFNSVPLKKYIVSFVIAFAITLVILSLCSVLFAFFPPPFFVISAIHSYSGVFSAFIAAIIIGRGCVKHGMLTGVLSANAYILVLFLIGYLIFGKAVIMPQILKTLILTSLAGGAGGVIGINFK